MRTIVLSALLLGSLAASARSQGDESLRYRFESGVSVRTRETISMVQEISVGETTQRIELRQVLDVRRQVEAVDEDGVARLSHRIESLRLDAKGPMGEESYDSSDARSKPGVMTAAAAALVGISIRYDVSPKGEVSNLDGMDEVAEALREAGLPDPRGQVASQRQAIEQLFPRLPDGPVALGQTWTQSARIPSPPLGDTVFDVEYTYRGVDRVAERDCDRFDVVTKIRMEAAPGSGAKIESRVEKSRGSLAIDRGTGLPVATETELDLHFTIELEQGGVRQRIVQRLVQEQKGELVR